MDKVEKGKIWFLLLLLTITGNGWSQSIPWTVKVTGANHTLFISEAVAPSYAGMPLDMGDAIGVFYDSAGTLTCAGILEWTGVDTYITAYGSFAGAHGFKDGETFRFKLWKKLNNCIVDSVDVAFSAPDGMLITAESRYVDGGMSKITSLHGLRASVEYPRSTYCVNESVVQPTLKGKVSDLRYVSEPLGLTINAETGEVIPSQSKPGDYLIRYLTASCLSSTTFPMTIAAQPKIHLGADTTICNAGTLTLDAQNPGANYSWSTGDSSQQIVVMAAGTYSVQVSNADLCTAVDTIVVNISDFNLSALKVQGIAADCKHQGQILIDESSLRGGMKPFEYTIVDLHSKSSSKSSSPMIQVKDGVYRLLVTDRYGCTRSHYEPISISSVDDCDYPVLAPNSSGPLATLFVPYTGVTKIFDKQGVLLKQLHTPAHWDGTDENGNQVKMGDYYLISDGNESIIVTVIR